SAFVWWFLLNAKIVSYYAVRFSMPTRHIAALVSVLAVPAATYDVTFLVTREIRGAAAPTTSPTRSQQCAASSPCECFGGAARRRSYIGSGTTTDAGNVVALDTGAYFSGSGKFYSAFNGNASVEFFADSNYEAFGLTYRDFSAAGADGLAAYLTRARALNPSLPPATITNFNASGTALVEHVAPYQLIDLSAGRTLAVLSLTDPTHLAVTSPDYAKRLSSYWRALVGTLATLRRLPQGAPDVIACIITAIPVSAADVAAAGSTTAAETAALHRLVDEAVGVDVFLLGIGDAGANQAYIRRNWAGDDVLIVPARGLKYGTAIDNITASFTDSGLLIGASTAVNAIPLDCTAANDSTTQATLVSRLSEMDARLGESVGDLTEPLDSHTRAAPAPSDAAGCSRLDGTAVCGCRVAACAQGAVLADSIVHAASADVGLVNAGGIRAGVGVGPVSTGSLIEMLPFNNEVVRVRVDGAALREALMHSISALGLEDAATAPRGSFAQVSSSLRFDWFFRGRVPSLSHVYVKPFGRAEFERLNESASYTIAVPDYLAGGGDGYTMFAGRAVERIGRRQVDAAAQYLTAESPLAVGSYSERIRQAPEQVLLQVGILCNGEAAGSEVQLGRREECDHMHHVIELLNDKTDGFLDDLLPNAYLEVAEAHIGCVEGLGTTAVAQLQQALPHMIAAVGVGCSSDVAEIGSPSFRAAHAFDAVVLSGSSTATTISDEAAYPNVARLATNEYGGGKGNVEVAAQYSWRRISVLADDSTWGRSAAQAFVDFHVGRDGGSREDILNLNDEATFAFRIADFDDAPDEDAKLELARGLLEKLAALGTRIVYLVTKPSIQERIFAAASTFDLLNGVGFGWLGAWISEDALRLADGTPSTAAIAGAEGTLGMLESFDRNSPMYKDYWARWLRRSSTEACSRARETSEQVVFCDVDGVATGSPYGYSLGFAETLLALALALDADNNYLNPEFVASADALYAAVRNVGTAGYDSISGRVQLDEFADRLGFFDVMNLQVANSRRLAETSAAEHEAKEASGSEAHELETALASIPPRFQHSAAADGRRLAVPLSQSSVSYVVLGWWSPQSDDPPTIEGGSVVFPGGTDDIPSDEPPSATAGSIAGIIVGAIFAVAAAFVLLMVAQRRHAQRKIRSLKKELDQFRDTVVGVRCVAADFDPRRIAADAAGAVGATTTGESSHASLALARALEGNSNTVAAEAAVLPPPTEKRIPRARWFWQEDERNLSKHQPSDVKQPGNFVSYAGSVCR
ncbi:MAG: hypothetical protein CMO44_09965, partial [Verrucomicrobiales bacterium]|nr:hypothetical protein [Verrucomicrobiales bacterium]